MVTVSEAFKKAKNILDKANTEDSAFEVSVMMEDLLGLQKGTAVLGNDAVLSDEQENVLVSAAEKRANGYPLQYIIGNWEFFGRKFFVGEGVLIPRQETELLCECVLKFFAKREPPKIVDLCSGSGCIAITIAKELPKADVTAVELYDGAFDYLQKNNAYHGNCVKAIKADALLPFGEFDCVVSNPPYVSDKYMEDLQKEVTFEPKTSVWGGTDGLDFYRAIAKNWYPNIKSGGFIAFEIGDEQGRAVESILKENGYYGVSVWEDYSGLDRIVTAMK